jgi:hypothetical protein
MNSVFFRCDAYVTAEGNTFLRFFKYGESTPAITHIHETQARELRLAANWNSGERCLPSRETVRVMWDVSCQIKQCLCIVWKPLLSLKVFQLTTCIKILSSFHFRIILFNAVNYIIQKQVFYNSKFYVSNSSVPRKKQTSYVSRYTVWGTNEVLKQTTYEHLFC